MENLWKWHMVANGSREAARISLTESSIGESYPIIVIIIIMVVVVLVVVDRGAGRGARSPLYGGGGGGGGGVVSGTDGSDDRNLWVM